MGTGSFNGFGHERIVGLSCFTPSIGALLYRGLRGERDRERELGSGDGFVGLHCTSGGGEGQWRSGLCICVDHLLDWLFWLVPPLMPSIFNDISDAIIVSW